MYGLRTTEIANIRRIDETNEFGTLPKKLSSAISMSIEEEYSVFVFCLPHEIEDLRNVKDINQGVSKC